MDIGKNAHSHHSTKEMRITTDTIAHKKAHREKEIRPDSH